MLGFDIVVTSFYFELFYQLFPYIINDFLYFVNAIIKVFLYKIISFLTFESCSYIIM